MTVQQVMYFTKTEEDFSSLLVDIGMKRNVAKVLVFLANTGEATSRDIERGLGFRQSEVSQAMRVLLDMKFVGYRPVKEVGRGRPLNMYRLSISIRKILGRIERKKKEDTEKQLALIKQLQTFA